ncbi:Ubiquitin carboxyl-terminal hydrolase 3 [Camelus dromedarius]|uniref:ubiquitinyl hydrolase 1 n=1 Tax=Camelus dromedarius TaxID=9838 RepID=A0A5N4CZW3_CAMDR|nr:Ubiquitin carboxyl-terminal hydrolase 3 [Camelus dromedarius]
MAASCSILQGSTTTICATGLRNFGNTCFMNAILQSLRYVAPEPEYLTSVLSGTVEAKAFYMNRLESSAVLKDLNPDTECVVDMSSVVEAEGHRKTWKQHYHLCHRPSEFWEHMFRMPSFSPSDMSLVVEFRKTLCALWQGSQTAFSPESLFYVVWKILPNLR